MAFIWNYKRQPNRNRFGCDVGTGAQDIHKLDRLTDVRG